MGTISKVVRVGLVWSALLMTPIAATPRVDCLCPDGHVRPFCLGLFAPPSACCGGRQGSSGGAPAKRAACCRGRNLGNSPAGSRIAGTPCTKTLVAGKLQSVPPTSAAAQDETTALVLAPVPVSSGVPASPECRLSRHRHRLPPPTDLVISLQHLTI
jgi:hypothetical protein